MAFPRGGKNPNAGRKRGTANVRTREMIEQLIKDCGLLPCQVLLENMKYYYEKALAKEKAPAKTLTDKEKKEAAILRYRGMAAESAKDVAPYIHPRLTAIELSNDPDSPLTKPDIQITFLKAEDGRPNYSGQSPVPPKGKS